MAEHTLGPWTSHECDGTWYVFGPNSAMVADHNEDVDAVARIRGVGRGATNEEQEANARLIAAAPELLEALRLMLERFGHDEWASVHDAAVVQSARDAVAKAEAR